MAAIILGWNLGRWSDRDYDAAVSEVAETGQVAKHWNVAQLRSVRPGTEAWLFLQGRRNRGLIGHGIVLTEPISAGSGKLVSRPGGTISKIERYVAVSFDALLPVGNQVSPDILRLSVPSVPWDRIRSSGTPVDGFAEAAIRAVWQESGAAVGPDPTHQVPGTYPATAISRVSVNRYERSLEARRACIAFYGTSCAVCGFSFDVAYGEAARDFIHVHHVVPASQLGPDYQLDPISDLVPMCANCHAMAHQGVSTPRTVAELRRMVAGAGHMAGQTVDTESLLAQHDARQILEQHD